MSKSYVWCFIASIFIIVISFDVYLYCDGVPGNSISQVIIEASDKSSLAPFFIGFLMGGLALHFFDNYLEPRK